MKGEKTKKIIIPIILLVGLLNTTDFSTMSTKDLLSMRGTVGVDEREAFKTELQSRLSAQSTEEKEALGIVPGANGSQNGNAHGATLRDGSGGGSMGAAAGGLGTDAGGIGGGLGASAGGFGGGHGRGGRM